MKKLAVLSIIALSVSGLRAADPAPAPEPPAPAPQAGKPLPPLENEPNFGPKRRNFDGPDGLKKPHGPGRRDFAKMDHDKKGPKFQERGPRGERGEGGPKGGHGDMLAKELNLTPEQKAKAKEIMEATKPKIEAIREESQAKVKQVMADAVNELRPILTPEQQAVLDSFQKLRADKEALNKAQKALRPDKDKKSDKSPE